MKNIHIALFTVGSITGGVIIFVLLGVLRLPELSFLEKPVDPTSAPENSPYLIALEPTHLPPAATRTPIRRTVASRPRQASTQIPLRPTTTARVVSNGQSPERIGSSIEGPCRYTNAEVTSYPFPPIDTGCAYSGTLADYTVSTGAAAVDLELTNHVDTDFDENLQVLDVLLSFVS